MHTVPPYLLCQRPTFEKMNFRYFHQFYQVFSRKNATFQQNFITGIGFYYLALGLTIFSSFRANKNIFAWLRHVINHILICLFTAQVCKIKPGLIPRVYRYIYRERNESLISTSINFQVDKQSYLGPQGLVN